MCAGLVVFSRRYTRVVIFGTLFFLAAILPSLQVVPVGNAITADRYTYLPSIGLFYIAAEGFIVLMRKQWRCGRIIKPAVAACLVLAMLMCVSLTWQRCKVWKDSLTLWSDAAENYHDSAVIYYNRGIAYTIMVTMTRLFQITTRPLKSTPSMLMPTTTAGIHITIRVTMTRLFQITTKPLNSTPICRCL